MKYQIHPPRFVTCASVRLAILSTTLVLGIGQNAAAATVTWDGGSGGTNNWNGGAGGNSGTRNWDTNAAPAAGDFLVFAGTTRTTSNNSLTANTNFIGLTFSSGAGAFTLTGNAITLGGNVTNSSTNLQTINMNLILSGSRTFNASTGNLAVGGLISESGAGVGALVKSGNSTLTLTNQNTYTGGTTINAGTLALGHATNTLANTGAVTVDGATAILSIAGNSDTVAAVSLKNGGQITGTTGTLTGSSYLFESGTVSAILGGTAALNKSTAATVTLSGANAYTGSTSISSGVLNIRNASALGTTAGATTVSSGAALEIQGNITTLAEGLTLDGSGISAGGALRNMSGNNTYAGAITLNSATRINSDSGTLTLNVATGNAITSTNQNLTFGGDGNISVADAIATGSGTLTKDGAGILTLSATNTYTGLTDVQAGTLAYGANNVLSTGAVTISGGTLALSNFSDTVGAVTISSGSITGSGTLTGTSYSLQGGTVTANLGTGTATVTTGTTTLNGTAASTAVNVNSGTLALGSNNRLADAAAISLAGGMLDIAGFNDSVGAVTLTSGSIAGSGGVLTGSSYAVQAGSVSAILGGSAALTKSTAGTVTLSGQNTYTGGTTINAGTLALGHATNTLANTGAVTVDGATAILSIAGNSDTVGAVSLKNGGQITGTTGTLIGSSYAFESGSVSATLGGSAALTKSTAGTVTLSGANTYTGDTAINGGILALASTGSINNSSGVVLNNGDFNVSAIAGGYAVSSLKGNGSVTGDLTVSGTLGIGASPGTITFNDDLTLGASSISNFEVTLGFASYDLAASGLGNQTVTFGGTLNLIFESGFNTNGSVKIFDFENYIGNFSSVVTTGLAPSFSATFDQSTGILTVVPEPKAALLGALGALALLRRRRD